MTVNGVDWVLDEKTATESAGAIRKLVTYGRVPSIEVSFTNPAQSAGDILIRLNEAVEQIPQDGKCIGLADLD